MQIGVDSFAATETTNQSSGKENVKSINKLIERIVKSDELGLDVFGVGEHHRKEFLDSAPHLILSAAAAKTKNIILTSAVTVLSAADPVRVFQNYATLDLISNGLSPSILVSSKINLSEINNTISKLYNHKVRKDKFESIKVLVEPQT